MVERSVLPQFVGLPVRVYSEVHITRPPADVWRCFSDPTRWSAWSPICTECRVADGRPLVAGSTLVMRLRILGFTFAVRAPVVCVEPAEVIGWEFHQFGMMASHVYRLRAHGQGTLMSNEETLWGLPGPLRSLVRTWFASTDLSRRSLNGIRSVVERTGIAPP